MKTLSNENLEKLICLIKHRADRHRIKSEKFGELKPEFHSVWGGWQKGYYDGFEAALELLLDDLEELIDEQSKEY